MQGRGQDRGFALEFAKRNQRIIYLTVFVGLNYSREPSGVGFRPALEASAANSSRRSLI